MAPKKEKTPPPSSKPAKIGGGKQKKKVCLWYPLSIVAGGTTAKIMVAVKDNFLGKYIYKDTLDRNLAAVIYKDEKEIQKTSMKQHCVLRSATEFRYGYKIVENGNMRAVISINDVIEVAEILKDRPSWFRDCRCLDVLSVIPTGNGGTIELIHMQVWFFPSQ